jgi:LacI family transcriptional regulator
MAYVTMREIANALGLSKNTVSLALANDPQIPTGTRERVKAAAEKMGYAVNPVVSHLMAELRKSRTKAPTHTLALLNAYQGKDAFRTHPTIPTYVEGCRRRAAVQRYGTDTFWLHEPGLDGDALHRILRARGIRGVIVIGTMDDPHLPAKFQKVWDNHACVVTGLRTQEPTLSFCCVDHHALVLQAFLQALKLGYKRPALVIDDRIDRLVDRRFSAGMWIGQREVAAEQRTLPFYEVEKAREKPDLFYHWLKKEKPDVIFTLYTRVKGWLEAAGHKVPDDIGLIQLEIRRGAEDWAGMDQHNDLTGEAAVDMVISQLYNNEIGIPKFPRATLIEPTWVSGKTVKVVSAARKKR